MGKRGRKRKTTSLPKKPPEDSNTTKSNTTDDSIQNPESLEFSSDAREKISNLLPEGYGNQILTASAKREGNAEGNEALYGCVKLSIKTKDEALVWIRKFEKKTFTSYQTQQRWRRELAAGVFIKQFQCNYLNKEGLSSCKACLIMAVNCARKIGTHPDLGNLPSQVTIEFKHNHKIESEAYLKKLNHLRQLKSSFHTYFTNGHSSMAAHILHRCDLHSLYGSEFYDVVSDPEICPTYNWCLREYDKFKTTNSVNDRITISEAVSRYNNKHLDKYAISLHENEIMAISAPFMKSIFYTGFGEDVIMVRIFSSPKHTADRQRVILFLCHTPIGTLPVGIIIARNNNEGNICNGIKALVELLGMSYNPNTIISDESLLISGCLKKCFPDSQVVFNQFRLSQWAWRIIRSICADDDEMFQIVYNLFEVTLKSPTKEEFDENINGFLVYVEKFPILFDFLKLFKLKAESYVQYACPEIDIRNNVLSYTDSGTIILQDIVTKYAQYFNTIQLFDFLTKSYLQHYKRKFEKIVNGELKGFFKTNFYIPSNKIIDLTCRKISASDYLLRFKNGEVFFVNPSLDTCTCQITIKAGSCVHKYIVDSHCGLMPECYTPLSADMLDIFKSISNSIENTNNDSRLKIEPVDDLQLLLNNDDDMDAFDEINLAASFESLSKAIEEEFCNNTEQYNKVTNGGSKAGNLSSVMDSDHCSIEAESSNLDFEDASINITDSEINPEITDLRNSLKNIENLNLDSDNIPKEVGSLNMITDFEIHAGANVTDSKVPPRGIENLIILRDSKGLSEKITNSINCTDAENPPELETGNIFSNFFIPCSNAYKDFENTREEIGRANSISDSKSKNSNSLESEKPPETIQIEYIFTVSENKVEISNLLNNITNSENLPNEVQYSKDLTDYVILPEKVEVLNVNKNSGINTEVEITNSENLSNEVQNSKGLIDYEILPEKGAVSNVHTNSGIHAEVEVTNSENLSNEVQNSKSLTDNLPEKVEISNVDTNSGINTVVEITNSKNLSNEVQNSKDLTDYEILPEKVEISNVHTNSGINAEVEVKNSENRSNKVQNSKGLTDYEILPEKVEIPNVRTNSEINAEVEFTNSENLSNEVQNSKGLTDNLPEKVEISNVCTNSEINAEVKITNFGNLSDKVENSKNLAEDEIILEEIETSNILTNYEINAEGVELSDIANSENIIDYEIFPEEVGNLKSLTNNEIFYAKAEFSNNITNTEMNAKEVEILNITNSENLPHETEISNAKVGNSNSLTDYPISFTGYDILPQEDVISSITNSEILNNSMTLTDYEIFPQEVEISNIPNSENLDEIPLGEVKIEEVEITSSENLPHEAEIANAKVLNSKSFTYNEIHSAEAELSHTAEINAEVEIPNITNSENLPREVEYSNAEVGNSKTLTGDEILCGGTELSNDIRNSEMNAVEEVEISYIVHSEILPNNPTSFTDYDILPQEILISSIINSEITDYEFFPQEVEISNISNSENLDEIPLGEVKTEEVEIPNITNSENPPHEVEISNAEVGSSKSLTENEIHSQEPELSKKYINSEINAVVEMSNITNSEYHPLEVGISEGLADNEILLGEAELSHITISEINAEDDISNSENLPHEVEYSNVEVGNSKSLAGNEKLNSEMNAEEVEISPIAHSEILPNNPMSFTDYDILPQEIVISSITNSEIILNNSMSLADYEMFPQEIEISMIPNSEDLDEIPLGEVKIEEVEIPNITSSENLPPEAEISNAKVGNSKSLTDTEIHSGEVELSNNITNCEINAVVEISNIANSENHPHGVRILNAEVGNSKGTAENEILLSEGELSHTTISEINAEVEIRNMTNSENLPHEVEHSNAEVGNSKTLADMEILCGETELSDNIKNSEMNAEEVEISNIAHSETLLNNSMSLTDYNILPQEVVISSITDSEILLNNSMSLTDYDIFPQEVEISMIPNSENLDEIPLGEVKIEEVEIPNITNSENLPCEAETSNAKVGNSKSLTDNEIHSADELLNKITNSEINAVVGISNITNSKNHPHGVGISNAEVGNSKGLADNEILLGEGELSHTTISETNAKVDISNVLLHEGEHSNVGYSKSLAGNEILCGETNAEEVEYSNIAYSETLLNNSTDYNILPQEVVISSITDSEILLGNSMSFTDYDFFPQEVEISMIPNSENRDEIPLGEVKTEEVEFPNITNSENLPHEVEISNAEVGNSKSITDGEIHLREAELSNIIKNSEINAEVEISNTTNSENGSHEVEVSNVEVRNSKGLADNDIHLGFAELVNDITINVEVENSKNLTDNKIHLRETELLNKIKNSEISTEVEISHISNSETFLENSMTLTDYQSNFETLPDDQNEIAELNNTTEPKEETFTLHNVLENGMLPVFDENKHEQFSEAASKNSKEKTPETIQIPKTPKIQLLSSIVIKPPFLTQIFNKAKSETKTKVKEIEPIRIDNTKCPSDVMLKKCVEISESLWDLVETPKEVDANLGTVCKNVGNPFSPKKNVAKSRVKSKNLPGESSKADLQLLTDKKFQEAMAKLKELVNYKDNPSTKFTNKTQKSNDKSRGSQSYSASRADYHTELEPIWISSSDDEELDNAKTRKDKNRCIIDKKIADGTKVGNSDLDGNISFQIKKFSEEDNRIKCKKSVEPVKSVDITSKGVVNIIKANTINKTVPIKNYDLDKTNSQSKIVANLKNMNFKCKDVVNKFKGISIINKTSTADSDIKTNSQSAEPASKKVETVKLSNKTKGINKTINTPASNLKTDQSNVKIIMGHLLGKEKSLKMTTESDMQSSQTDECSLSFMFEDSRFEPVVEDSVIYNIKNMNKQNNYKIAYLPSNEKAKAATSHFTLQSVKNKKQEHTKPAENLNPIDPDFQVSLAYNKPQSQEGVKNKETKKLPIKSKTAFDKPQSYVEPENLQVLKKPDEFGAKVNRKRKMSDGDSPSAKSRTQFENYNLSTASVEQSTNKTLRMSSYGTEQRAVHLIDQKSTSVKKDNQTKCLKVTVSNSDRSPKSPQTDELFSAGSVEPLKKYDSEKSKKAIEQPKNHKILDSSGKKTDEIGRFGINSEKPEINSTKQQNERFSTKTGDFDKTVTSETLGINCDESEIKSTMKCERTQNEHFNAVSSTETENLEILDFNNDSTVKQKQKRRKTTKKQDRKRLRTKSVGFNKTEDLGDDKFLGFSHLEINLSMEQLKKSEILQKEHLKISNFDSDNSQKQLTLKQPEGSGRMAKRAQHVHLGVQDFDGEDSHIKIPKIEPSSANPVFFSETENLETSDFDSSNVEIISIIEQSKKGEKSTERLQKEHLEIANVDSDASLQGTQIEYSSGNPVLFTETENLEINSTIEQPKKRERSAERLQKEHLEISNVDSDASLQKWTIKPKKSCRLAKKAQHVPLRVSDFDGEDLHVKPSMEKPRKQGRPPKRPKIERSNANPVLFTETDNLETSDFVSSNLEINSSIEQPKEGERSTDRLQKEKLEISNVDSDASLQKLTIKPKKSCRLAKRRQRVHLGVPDFDGEDSHIKSSIEKPRKPGRPPKRPKIERSGANLVRFTETENLETSDFDSSNLEVNSTIDQPKRRERSTEKLQKEHLEISNVDSDASLQKLTIKPKKSCRLAKRTQRVHLGVSNFDGEVSHIKSSMEKPRKPGRPPKRPKIERSSVNPVLFTETENLETSDFDSSNLEINSTIEQPKKSAGSTEKLQKENLKISNVDSEYSSGNPALFTETENLETSDFDSSNLKINSTIEQPKESGRLTEKLLKEHLEISNVDSDASLQGTQIEYSSANPVLFTETENLETSDFDSSNLEINSTIEQPEKSERSTEILQKGHLEIPNVDSEASLQKLTIKPKKSRRLAIKAQHVHLEVSDFDGENSHIKSSMEKPRKRGRPTKRSKIEHSTANPVLFTKTENLEINSTIEQPKKRERSTEKLQKEHLEISNVDSEYSSVNPALCTETENLETSDFDSSNWEINSTIEQPKKSGRSTEKLQKEHLDISNVDGDASLQGTQIEYSSANSVLFTESENVETSDFESSNLKIHSTIEPPKKRGRSTEKLQKEHLEISNVDSDASLQKLTIKPKKSCRLAKRAQHVHLGVPDFEGEDSHIKSSMKKPRKLGRPPKRPEIEPSSAHPVLFTETGNLETSDLDSSNMKINSTIEQPKKRERSTERLQKKNLEITNVDSDSSLQRTQIEYLSADPVLFTETENLETSVFDSSNLEINSTIEQPKKSGRSPEKLQKEHLEISNVDSDASLQGTQIEYSSANPVLFTDTENLETSDFESSNLKIHSIIEQPKKRGRSTEKLQKEHLEISNVDSDASLQKLTIKPKKSCRLAKRRQRVHLGVPDFDGEDSHIKSSIEKPRKPGRPPKRPKIERSGANLVRFTETENLETSNFDSSNLEVNSTIDQPKRRERSTEKLQKEHLEISNVDSDASLQKLTIKPKKSCRLAKRTQRVHLGVSDFDGEVSHIKSSMEKPRKPGRPPKRPKIERSSVNTVLFTETENLETSDFDSSNLEINSTIEQPKKSAGSTEKLQKENLKISNVDSEYSSGNPVLFTETENLETSNFDSSNLKINSTIEQPEKSERSTEILQKEHLEIPNVDSDASLQGTQIEYSSANPVLFTETENLETSDFDSSNLEINSTIEQPEKSERSTEILQKEHLEIPNVDSEASLQKLTIKPKKSRRLAIKAQHVHLEVSDFDGENSHIKSSMEKPRKRGRPTKRSKIEHSTANPVLFTETENLEINSTIEQPKKRERSTEKLQKEHLEISNVDSEYSSVNPALCTETENLETSDFDSSNRSNWEINLTIEQPKKSGRSTEKLQKEHLDISNVDGDASLQGTQIEYSSANSVLFTESENVETSDFESSNLKIHSTIEPPKKRGRSTEKLQKEHLEISNVDSDASLQKLTIKPKKSCRLAKRAQHVHLGVPDFEGEDSHIKSSMKKPRKLGRPPKRSEIEPTSAHPVLFTETEHLETSDFDSSNLEINSTIEQPKKSGRSTERLQKKNLEITNVDGDSSLQRTQIEYSSANPVLFTETENLETSDFDSSNLEINSTIEQPKKSAGSTEKLQKENLKISNVDSDASLQKLTIKPKKNSRLAKKAQHVHLGVSDFDDEDSHIKSSMEKPRKPGRPPKRPKIQRSSVNPVLFTETENLETSDFDSSNLEINSTIEQPKESGRSTEKLQKEHLEISNVDSDASQQKIKPKKSCRLAKRAQHVHLGVSDFDDEDSHIKLSMEKPRKPGRPSKRPKIERSSVNPDLFTETENLETSDFDSSNLEINSTIEQPNKRGRSTGRLQKEHLEISNVDSEKQGSQPEGTQIENSSANPVLSIETNNLDISGVDIKNSEIKSLVRQSKRIRRALKDFERLPKRNKNEPSNTNRDLMIPPDSEIEPRKGREIPKNQAETEKSKLDLIVYLERNINIDLMSRELEEKGRAKTVSHKK